MGRLMILPLCGVDESMVGFSINGWEIKKLFPRENLCSFIESMKDSVLYSQISRWLDTEDLFIQLSYINDAVNPYYLLMIKATDDVSEIKPIVDTLRFFKDSCFGCWNPVELNHGEILPIKGGQSYSFNALQTHSPFSLSDVERTQLATFYQKRNQEKYAPEINIMMSFFHESCRTTNQYLNFVTRVTILEMLIEGNAELSYRLKHHLSVFLGRNKEESIHIANNLKNIYNARSKFLHEGDASKISDELSDLAYDYSRRLIANLLCTTDTLKRIRLKLEQSGYGDNPYGISL